MEQPKNWNSTGTERTLKNQRLTIKKSFRRITSKPIPYLSTPNQKAHTARLWRPNLSRFSHIRLTLLVNFTFGTGTDLPPNITLLINFTFGTGTDIIIDKR